MAGKFITLEGIEGAGKTTQAPLLRDALERLGKSVLLTREPGGTALGEQIRAVLLSHHQPEIDPDAELLLLFAARAQHLQEVIRPALAAGIWVICDRFTDASYAYQGGGRGIPVARIGLLENWVQPGVVPDLTLLFDLPVAAGLQRAGHRGWTDRFEREAAPFFERVRAAYRDRATRDPQRCRVIDASGTPEQVQATVEQVLQAQLAQWHD